MKQTSYSYRVVKSRLVPLSLFAQWFEYIIELLPRKRYRMTMESNSEIVVLNTHKGQFKSIGTQPSFELVSDLPFLHGWYYFETALTNNNGNRTANIYAIDHHGDETVIPIPSNLRGSVREVIFIPRGTIALFWSPTASMGYFSQSPILFHKITWLEGYLRRTYRIWFDYFRFSEKQTIKNTTQLLCNLLIAPQKAYQESANYRISRVIGNDYEVFLKKYSNASKKQLHIIKREISSWEMDRLFSVVLPLTQIDNSSLEKTIKSLQSQLYPYWELVILIDAAVFDTMLSSILKALVYSERRVRLVDTSPLTTRADRLNGAISKSLGEYITFMRQGDQLHRNALYRLMQQINRTPLIKMIYSDSDKIDPFGQRSEPCFKPDWNPELFYSIDYIDGMCLYKTDAIREIGGFRDGYDGAEEYDVALRLAHSLREDEISHIPKILYHVYSDNYAAVGRVYDHDAGKKALQSLFESSGATVVDGAKEKLYRVKYPLSTLPLVSIIIPTRDKINILKMCVESILEHTEYPNWEIIIIDNNSIETQTHDYFAKISKDIRIKVYPYNQPFNYSELNNVALNYAKGEILTLLNNDIEIISRGWLSELVRHVIRPDIGVVGAKLLYPDGLVQHAGVILGIGGVAGHGHKYINDDDPGYCYRAAVVQNISAVTGACLCVRREIYERVGGFDENLAVAFNDIDFCLQVREIGYRNLYTPYAKMIHHESISRGHDDTSKKHTLFLNEYNYMKKKWEIRLKNDPAYNPNLTHQFENFSW